MTMSACKGFTVGLPKKCTEIIQCVPVVHICSAVNALQRDEHKGGESRPHVTVELTKCTSGNNWYLHNNNNNNNNNNKKNNNNNKMMNIKATTRYLLF